MRDGEVNVSEAAEYKLVSDSLSVPADRSRCRELVTTHIIDPQTMGCSLSFISKMLYPKLCQSITTFCLLRTDTALATKSVGMAGGFWSSKNPAVGGMV
jgi:hypothetical protein